MLQSREEEEVPCRAQHPLSLPLPAAGPRTIRPQPVQSANVSVPLAAQQQVSSQAISEIMSQRTFTFIHNTIKSHTIPHIYDNSSVLLKCTVHF